MSELNIPEHWAEVNFEQAILIQGGSQPPKSDFVFAPKKGYVRLVQIRDFRTDDHPVYIPEEKAKRSFTKDDIMIGRYGPPVFQILRGKEGSYNVALMKASPSGLMKKEFMYWFLKNPIIYRDVNAVAQRSAGQTGVNLDFLNKYPVPIPPLGEQERIVQKIEACFQKINETEKSLNEVEVLLSKYRESLLAKAFRGELIPQDPKDEPASKLLEKIRVERVKNLNGKKIQEFAPISDEEKPCDLPKGWEWVKLGELINLFSGQHIEEKDYNNNGKGTPYLTGPSDFGDISPVITKWTPKPKVIAPKNSLLITVKGSGVGKTNINLLEGVCISRQLMAVEPHKISLHYLDYFMSFSFHKIAEKAQGLIPGLSREDITQILFPLAPMLEQERIAITITSQLNHVAQFKMDIERKKHDFSKMKESILLKAFEGQLVEQIPSEGTGHELLAKIISEKEISLKLESKVDSRNVSQARASSKLKAVSKKKPK